MQRREEDEADPERPLSQISTPPMVHRRPPERSIHDAQRDPTPFTVSAVPETASRWRTFAYGSLVPPPTSHSEKIKKDDNWLDEQGDLDGPWLANTRDPENDGGSNDDELLFVSAKTRRRWYTRIKVRWSRLNPLSKNLESLINAMFTGHVTEQSDGAPYLSGNYMDIILSRSCPCS